MKTSSAPLFLLLVLLSVTVKNISPGPVPTPGDICRGCKSSCSAKEYFVPIIQCHNPDEVYCCDIIEPTDEIKCKGHCRSRCLQKEYVASTTFCPHPDYVYCCRTKEPAPTKEIKCKGCCKLYCPCTEFMASTTFCHHADHVSTCTAMSM